MRSKNGRLGILVALGVVVLLSIAAVAASYSELGVVSEAGSGGLPLSARDLSGIPQAVVEDATMLAKELFGSYGEKYEDFASQLLAIYLEARDKDFVVVFNPGGWGWNLSEASQGWQSILDGIQSELNGLGYEALVLDYRRTVNTWQGRLTEAKEMLNGYSSKSKDLASTVEFLTAHVPDLKVIVAGESTGTVISDRVINILAGNPQVYSIQTGPPFWHRSVALARELVITNNGVVPDSFSYGEFLTLVRANLGDLFGLPQSQGDSGAVAFSIRAPGHDYRWQYPEVYSQIAGFFRQNFGIEW
ncbi:MAG: hypothetical protein HY530_00420 [Chloroflexi bacterium]|nr:hypothetical protein [Chloroflexota bacterium]